jgi:glycosyltransferase involved in cell wall biosynthesis
MKTMFALIGLPRFRCIHVRLLIVIPSWPAFSEVWMHRMISLLATDTAGIATYVAPCETWNGQIPVFQLAPRLGKIAGLLRLPSLIRDLGAHRLQRIIQELRVTHVLCHYVTTALCFASTWQRSNVPVFVHCHGYDVTWNLKGTQIRGVRRFRRDYKDRVRRLSQRVILIANSEFTKKNLEGIGVAANRIRVKYLGVPIDHELPAVRSQSTDLNLLFLGRLTDFKGPDKTIEAFDLACRQGVKGRLTMAGDGPLRWVCEKLREKSSFRDHIRLLGSVSAEHAQELLRQADVFTAHNCTGPTTNQQEAYGVSFVEAMAAGLPVTTGRSGGVCETVQPGKTGILFDPGDLFQHAAAFRTLQNWQLRREFGYQGWCRARDHFSLQKEKSDLSGILAEATPK